MARTILYTAAHGGFAGQPVPLGGGAAVCNLLTDEWSRTRPFPFRLLDPSILSGQAPSGSELVKFSEMRYARFCRQFEKACTEEVLRHDPARTAVLVNDVSEGPDFQSLAAYPIYTIYHVDVVAYVAAIYGKSLFEPETLTRWYDRISKLVSIPDVLQLIFEKQKRSVVYSRGLIVPSDGMREILERCYPEHAPGKVHVMPWGVPDVSYDDREIDTAAAALRQELQIPPAAHVLLTLSRISPEKGQDQLLRALRRYQGRPLYVLICGGAAYMQGHVHLAKLKKLASELGNCTVLFPGHVTGIRKQAFFRLADLYVFPSRHESYGLTLLEALQAGLPAVCLDHSGARSVMRNEFGILTKPEGLLKALTDLLENPGKRREMSEAARKFARTQPFSATAAQLAELLKSC